MSYKDYILKESDIRDQVIDLYKSGGGKTYYLGFNALAKYYSIKEGGVTDWTGYPGSGKCLAKGTKVVMYDGALKNVEDVRVGDKLMGIDSTPRTVLSLARGREQMYWIRQNRGVDYKVNESHILSLRKNKHTYGRYKTLPKHNEKHTLVNISVKDYLKTSKYLKHILSGWKSGVEFNEKDLLIEPYYLGIWLGDGSRSSSKITNPEPEIHKYINSYASKMGLRSSVYKSVDKCMEYAIVGRNGEFIKKMKRLNLINNKHIPDDYLYNSTSNRLKLLAGLLDSDGHLSSPCAYEIIQKRENLIRQIKFLCDSLGFHTTLTKKHVKVKPGLRKMYWRLTISISRTDIPMLIERKKPIKKSNSIYTGIKVEKDSVDDYYGFVIDGDKMFLLEDFTVTHNTELLLECIKNTGEWYGHKYLLYMPDAGTQAEVIAKLIHKVSGKQFDQWYYDSNGNKVEINNRISMNEMLNTIPRVLDHFVIFNPAGSGSRSKAVTPTEFWEYAANNKKDLGIFGAVIDSWNYMKHDTEGYSREDKWLEATLSHRNELAESNNLHFHTVIHPKSARKDKTGKIIMPDMHDIKGGSEFSNNGKSIIIVHREFGSRLVDIKIDKAKPKVVGVRGVTCLEYDINKGAYFELVDDKKGGRRKYAEKDPVEIKGYDHNVGIEANDQFDYEQEEEAPF